MRVAAAQAHPVWLDAAATADRVVAMIEHAADEQVDLVAFPETFLPGYPFWVMLGGVDRFNAERQKEAYAAYVEAAVDVGGPEVTQVADAACRCGVFIYLGVAEHAHGSVFASLLAVDPQRGVVSCHRKLMPTDAERTVWALGDGNGLRVHHTGALRVGGLNCWENWMPQARLADLRRRRRVPPPDGARTDGRSGGDQGVRIGDRGAFTEVDEVITRTMVSATTAIHCRRSTAGRRDSRPPDMSLARVVTLCRPAHSKTPHARP